MGRMHSRGKGISASALPYKRTPPSWLKISTQDVEDNICKLAKKGQTPYQIGVLLRDSHGIAQVKSVTGSKVLRILKAHGLAPEIPEDLYHLIKKAVAIRKLLERNRKDKDSKFRLKSQSWMHSQSEDHIGSLLKVLPPVDFCCVYGSSLHPNNDDKSKMVDYILGVSDPLQWHTENLKMNRDHYASWMAYLGGAKLITKVADNIGVGVHFNPFVAYNDRLFKYGVVRMSDLVEDVLQWKRFYLSGRLQKPVNVLVDNLEIKNTNSVNLRAAVSAALLLLPAKFTEADLYAKICSLSYMGDVRMLFAEDRNKVKNIVAGQFDLFKKMYGQTLVEYEAKDILKVSSPNGPATPICQDFSLPAAQTLVSNLPSMIKREMKVGDYKRPVESGQAEQEIVIKSREETAKRMMKVVRRTVMVSSARQAVSGLIAVGGANAARYVSSKILKAWKSWT